MARYYYAITSTKRLQEEKSVNGYKTVKIKGVTKIEENGNDVHSYNNITNGRKDFVFNFLMIAAIIDLSALILLMLVADYLNIDMRLVSLTSDYIAGAGVLATVYSFPKIRKYISEKIFLHGKLGNKLIVSFFVLAIPFFIAVMLYYIGLTSKFANILSAVCVIISLKNMQ